MPSALRDQIRYWANQHCTVRLSFTAHGGERQAYAAGRSIVTSFASLRAWERRKVNKRQLAKGEAPLVFTPYEDIVCRLVKFEDRYDVTFLKVTEEDMKRLFDDGSPVERPEGWTFPSVNDPGRTVLNGLNDPAAIPEDVDPFTGEKLTLETLEAVDSGETQA